MFELKNKQNKNVSKSNIQGEERKSRREWEGGREGGREKNEAYSLTRISRHVPRIQQPLSYAVHTLRITAASSFTEKSFRVRTHYALRVEKQSLSFSFMALLPFLLVNEKKNDARMPRLALERKRLCPCRGNIPAVCWREF